MAPNILKLVFIQIVVYKAGSVVSQSPLKQYFHVTGLGAPPPVAVPTCGTSTRQTVPNAGLSALSALALPSLIQALASTVATTTPTPQTQIMSPPVVTQALPSPSIPSNKQKDITPSDTSNGLDSNVLNNLAIALQLLIVSNLLNSNQLTENEVNPIYEMLETAKNIPISFSQKQNGDNSLVSTQGHHERELPKYAQHPSYSEPSRHYSEQRKYPERNNNYAETFHMPNANFVGSAGFGEPALMAVSDSYTKANTRNNYQLMSPYEALAPNSLYSDPILSSPYGSVMHSKKDFHSPYVMMESDPFAMNDLFR